VIGLLHTAAGDVPKVSTAMTWKDRLGSFKVRCGVGRHTYTVEPGLYAVGEPDTDSEVLVTANYKLSFDSLRRRVRGMNVWILVLDTDGINVWCAAGKGAFGTAEIVARIDSSGLSRVVSHRRLILPQLAGPGVAAHQVKRLSGFTVTYGPIKASDVPAFIDSGFEATPAMRRKTFGLGERVVLIPVELTETLKYGAILVPAVFLLAGLGGPGPFWVNAWHFGLFAVYALLGAIVAGAVLTPILLPWLPGRAFSLKGALVGLVVALCLAFTRADAWDQLPERLDILAWMLIVPALAAYLAMNFTGASTYTSLSGVRKEMRIAVPLQIIAAVVGLGLLVGSRLAH
jgi:acetyl-CoA decarbonylase/synthase complex subunit gamma